MITITNKLVLSILFSPASTTVNNRSCFINGNAEQRCWNNSEQHCRWTWLFSNDEPCYYGIVQPPMLKTFFFRKKSPFLLNSFLAYATTFRSIEDISAAVYEMDRITPHLKGLNLKKYFFAAILFLSSFNFRGIIMATRAVLLWLLVFQKRLGLEW